MRLALLLGLSSCVALACAPPPAAEPPEAEPAPSAQTRWITPEPAAHVA